MKANKLNDNPKKVLVVSQGPVPTPEHQKVEGGGLRCWGLAKGLVGNGDQIEVTVAYHESYKTESFTEQYEEINLKTWNDQNIKDIIAEYDTVIVSYCMGSLSVAVVDSLETNQQLILDCYVPIYVEISARNTDNLDREYGAFHSEIGRWAHVLRRGDIFLCASDAQKKYYKGVLSAVGRINPVTYDDELLVVVPFGIYKDKPKITATPISDRITDSAQKKILWFGGIYPWFDLRNLVEAVKILNKDVPAKLVIVGAKNPFNNHPDFTRPYDQLVEYIEENDLQNLVVLQEWISFEDRANWYLDSDLVVVVNKEGEENALSWRTRLVDFMWADLPIISNGGDPLGEVLLENNAALRFSGLAPIQMAGDLQKALSDTKKLTSVQKNLTKLKEDFYWDKTTKHLYELVVENKIAKDRERYGSYTIATEKIKKRHPLGRIYKKARKLPSYAKRHGLRNTYYIAKTVAKNKLKISAADRGPKILIFSHQLDMSGAPFVLMDLVNDLTREHPSLPVEFHTFNPAENENIKQLNKIGIRPIIHATKDVTVKYVKGDVVVLNTVAHSGIFKEALYKAAETGVVQGIVWYIHEDEPELIFDSYERKTIKKLIEKDKLIIYSAANKTVKNYQKYFSNTSNIRKQQYKYVIPDRFKKVRKPEEFSKLNFILTGTVGDGRKGQLPIFYAFKEFYDLYFVKNRDVYRDFELKYVGITDDFLSRQLLLHSEKALGGKFKYEGRVSHSKSSELMMESNITICYSMRECLPLFVFEGMAAGHPILRNDCSGMEEQLINEKNGLYIDSTDFKQTVDTIERIMNKEKTTNKQLSSMSKESNKIAEAQARNEYTEIVRCIVGSFVKKS